MGEGRGDFIMIFEALLGVYITSIVLLLISTADLSKTIEKKIGKPLMKAYSRRNKEERTLIKSLKAIFTLVCPIYNTLSVLGIFMFTEAVLDATMESMKKDFTRWGIDFEKSKNVESEDYIVALEQLDGIKRLDEKVGDLS